MSSNLHFLTDILTTRGGQLVIFLLLQVVAVSVLAVPRGEIEKYYNNVLYVYSLAILFLVKHKVLK